MAKNLPLPPLEELKEHFDYNPDTGIIIWKKKQKHWKVEIGQEAGCFTTSKSKKYRTITSKGIKYKTHRIAYYMHHGIDPRNNYIDHEDGNGLNNKIDNLRLATHSDNCRNRSMNENNTSGVTGVTWNKQAQKWRGSIMIDYKSIGLGYHSNIQDAMQARKEAEKKYFGEFRRSD